MCISPNKLSDGTLVACRKCRLCRDNAIKDWAGRCIAESKTSKCAYFVTLTYGRDEYGDSGHIRAAVLTYSDIQKYFKRLRKTVGKFKYFAVGEYGSKKGRAHWHLILFMDAAIPDIELDRHYIEKHWPYGWSFFKEFNYKQAYYCCKYVYKGVDDPLAMSMHQMSKKPPIGHEYFQRLADSYVEAGIAPQDLFYSFAEVRKQDGKPVVFKMGGKTAENFCERFLTQWQAKYGKSLQDYVDVRFGALPGVSPGVRHIPASLVIDDYLDRRIAGWSERADTWRAHWEMQQIKAEKDRRYVEEVEEKRRALARPDTCECADCAARRAVDPDWRARPAPVGGFVCS